MLIFLALLVLSGLMSVLFAAFLHYGFAGLLELFEVFCILGVILVTLITRALGVPSRLDRARAQAAAFHKDSKHDLDEHGIPILR